MPSRPGDGLGTGGRAPFTALLVPLQTTSFLKLRWFVGTAFLAVPVALSHYRAHHFVAAPLPKDAVVHIAIAWAVGALMSFLADTYRRCEIPSFFSQSVEGNKGAGVMRWVYIPGCAQRLLLAPPSVWCVPCTGRKT